MNNWFYQPEIPFYMWGTAHLITIVLIFSIIFSLFLWKKSLLPYRRTIRLTVGSLLIISRISLEFWYIRTETWDIRSSLPLELCSISSLVCGIMLLTKNRQLFEVFYFIGIGGAIQAILTPDLNFGFPQYRFWQFFIDHMLLILAPLMMISLYQFTITIRSVLKAFITINAIAVIVFIINLSLSANYMFLRHKPSAASLLDLLGPYPWYLLSLEGITLVVFFILYSPFAWKNFKTKNNRF
ncbi:TIGR02206 family membrane protein [Pseudogracilibacillus auburnensis]|uniref:Putative integral membrane protein (TIGR02206 family) n=1 Tax=Pseudogracilibacillus auburnensis TaxID=1494959 RepID=A0A2V3VSP5_9BACI|nr:TIGR02206 family membrane protein [Pseudogracilibacillus auburnensis]PXW84776.1 putative integral membrane protein (TIGR02206 family) [Pseudogracilibacillus auburnensis]